MISYQGRFSDKVAQEGDLGTDTEPNEIVTVLNSRTVPPL